MNIAEKVRENRIRRALDRRGYRLMRSRTRDPHALTFGGYQIADIRTGGIAFGYGNAGRGYAASLEQVEDWLQWLHNG